ncbi:polysaccharide deacetylase family protein [Methylocella sp. CPCC 101449]|uniref:polysaccharide deacetylase family protein n=1 Tax=Methylocella sp. CPCC 101449 TaxID=2987531 RepID=UPI0028912F7D|nr:polysaccharide deacetylase family protein [Methylocella sp. CPCC 101449]MDT2021281.1 polysaccharide deacetylase family protein [Methylocella sp. CPCC 101449]
MSINLALEAFRFKSQYTQEGRPGQVDHFSLSYARYGAKAGVYRILDLLDETGLKASMSINGKAAELYPDQIRAVADAGHEPVGHGWENDMLTNDSDPEQELEEIRRVTKAITDAAGVRPVGWTSPGSAGSSNTLNFLAAEGYLWNGDEADDDLPYVKTTTGGPMVLLPRVNTPTNDLSIWIAGKNPPSVIWEQFKDTFDELYAEGQRGHPKWIEIVLHAHMAGRPTLIPTIRKCIAYAKQHENVWFARKRDIAEWTLKREG